MSIQEDFIKFIIMNLITRIKKRKIRIGIIGLGYVGLPLAKAFLEAGFLVYGFDVDKNKVEKLKKGKSYISYISGELIEKHIKNKTFIPLSNFDKIKETDVIIICVPTPLGKHFEPDISFIVNTAKEISLRLRKGQTVILESTTFPGTTREILKPILESSGLSVGKDFFLGYSPEREDPGNEQYATKNIPKIVSGVTKKCLRVVKTLYDQVVDKTVPVSSPEVAEAAKLLENIYRAVNIALVNELKMVFDKMGINIWEVIEAASTKPFGFQPFYPGPGVGGHCIPIDPFYLTWKAKELGMHTRFIELAGEVNREMPHFVVQKVIYALNQKKKAINGAKILILGVAHKPDVDDMRESPALEIMHILETYGAHVDYNDPYIPVLPATRKYRYSKKSIRLTAASLKKYDVVIVTTDHSKYDPDFIKKHAKLIIDTRNMFKTKGLKEGKIWKA